MLCEKRAEIGGPHVREREMRERRMGQGLDGARRERAWERTTYVKDGRLEASERELRGQAERGALVAESRASWVGKEFFLGEILRREF